MKKTLFLAVVLVTLLTSCSENYSNGERIGVITQFSETGLIWKSWEGHLNVTQTGMNSSVPFDFSIDNDRTDQLVINTLDSAAQHGWKVKLIYHETVGKNWLANRGETNHFITKVEVLEKNFGNAFNGSTKSTVNQSDKLTELELKIKELSDKVSKNTTPGRVDTVFVVIDRSRK